MTFQWFKIKYPEFDTISSQIAYNHYDKEFKALKTQQKKMNLFKYMIKNYAKPLLLKLTLNFNNNIKFNNPENAK